GKEYDVVLYALRNKTIGRTVSCSVAEGAAGFVRMKCDPQLLQTSGKSWAPVEICCRIMLATDIAGPHMSRIVKILGDHPAARNVIATDCRHLQVGNIAVEKQDGIPLSPRHRSSAQT